MREPDAPEQRASPRGETFPLHQVPAKRDQAASDTESAPTGKGLQGTHKASCALPRCTAAGGSLWTRPKRGAHKRARCGASGDTGNAASCLFPICGTAAALLLCGVSHSRKVESEATRQRGELSSPICETAAARICRDGAYRLMEGRIRGTRQRGELSSPICGTAAARNYRVGANRLMEGRFRGTSQRAIRRRRLHRRSHLHPLRPPTMWSERRHSSYG